MAIHYRQRPRSPGIGMAATRQLHKPILFPKLPWPFPCKCASDVVRHGTPDLGGALRHVEQFDGRA